VLLALGELAGMTTLVRDDTQIMRQHRKYAMPSTWVLMTRNPAIFNNEAIVAGTEVLRPEAVAPVLWTDDRTSLLDVLR
jgi:hypothetical protein